MPNNVEAIKRVIVAADVDTAEEFEDLIKRFKPEGFNFFKVGLQLISAEGPRVVEIAKKYGVIVFYDGKVCDIPNTCQQAIANISKTGADICNIHASAGLEAMQKANSAKGKAKLFAVTVLTSIGENLCHEIYGQERTRIETVLQFAFMAEEAGLDGVICSGEELIPLRKTWFKLLIIVPGIRPDWAPPQDQQVFMTPCQAFENGADAIVIGRALTNPPPGISQEEAIRRIKEELDGIYVRGDFDECLGNF